MAADLASARRELEKYRQNEKARAAAGQQGKPAGGGGGVAQAASSSSSSAVSAAATKQALLKAESDLEEVWTLLASVR